MNPFVGAAGSRYGQAFYPGPAALERRAARRLPSAAPGTRRTELTTCPCDRCPIGSTRSLPDIVSIKWVNDDDSCDVTLSEIALRCGRIKRDRRGNISGETSWLACRIGQLPEGGQQKPGPWIHSDVLALIARDGLCVSPHEVEL